MILGTRRFAGSPLFLLEGGRSGDAGGDAAVGVVPQDAGITSVTVTFEAEIPSGTTLVGTGGTPGLAVHGLPTRDALHLRA